MKDNLILEATEKLPIGISSKVQYTWLPWYSYLSWDAARLSRVLSYTEALILQSLYIDYCIKNNIIESKGETFKTPLINTQRYILEDLTDSANSPQDKVRYTLSYKLPKLDKVSSNKILKNIQNLSNYHNYIDLLAQNSGSYKDSDIETSALNILSEAEPLTSLVISNKYRLRYQSRIIYETHSYGTIPSQVILQRKQERFVTEDFWVPNSLPGIGNFTKYSKIFNPDYLDFNIDFKFDPLHEAEEAHSLP